LQAQQDIHSGIQDSKAGKINNDVDIGAAPQSPEPTDEEIQAAFEEFILESEPPNANYDDGGTWWFAGNSQPASIAGNLPSGPKAYSAAFTLCADAVPFVPRHALNHGAC
jgi:hypothetical protein